MNVIIFTVEGNVCEISSDSKEITFRGFKISDHVTWKKVEKNLTGKISALKDDNTCLVEVDSTQKLIETNYELHIKNQELKQFWSYLSIFLFMQKDFKIY